MPILERSELAGAVTPLFNSPSIDAPIRGRRPGGTPVPFLRLFETRAVMPFCVSYGKKKKKKVSAWAPSCTVGTEVEGLRKRLFARSSPRSRAFPGEARAIRCDRRSEGAGFALRAAHPEVTSMRFRESLPSKPDSVGGNTEDLDLEKEPTSPHLTSRKPHFKRSVRVYY